MCKQSRRDFNKSGVAARQARKMWVSSHDPAPIPGRGTLYFKCFETWKMKEFLAPSLRNLLWLKKAELSVPLEAVLKNSKIQSFLHMCSSLVRGIDFLARRAHHESFEYPLDSLQGGAIQRPLKKICGEEEDLRANRSTSSEDHSKESNGTEAQESILSGGPVPTPAATGLLGRPEALNPYLVVNIGSGVSVFRVDDAESFERVRGTSLWGTVFRSRSLLLWPPDSQIIEHRL